MARQLLLGAIAFALLSVAERASGAPALETRRELVLEVAELEAAAKQLESLARSLGGRLVLARGDVVVLELPVGRGPELSSGLAAVGAVESERESTANVSPEIAAAEAELAALEAALARTSALAQKAVGVADGLAAERERERVERAIASAKAKLEALRRRAGLLRATIRLAAPAIETIPAPVLPFPWLGDLGLERLRDMHARASDPELELRAFADGAVFVEAGHAFDADALGGDSTYGAGGGMLRVLGEASPVGIFGGFDFALGGGGGFLYELTALLGVGVPIGKRVAFGLAPGAGIDGMTTVIPFGVSLPIELYVAIDLASFTSVTAWVRDGWVVASSERQDGAEHSLFGDELSAGLTVSLGSREDGSYSDERFGPEIGIGYRELLGTRIYELRLGFGAWESDFSGAY